MDRRDVLKYTAYLTGYAVTAPLTSAILSGCKSEPAAPDFIPSFFTAEEYPAVRQMAELMLPKTDTPGAGELGIPQFVDKVLSTFTKPKDQERLRTGLNTWLGSIANEGGSPYAELGAEDQLRILNELDTTSKASAEELEGLGLSKEEKKERTPWWLDLKGLIIGGYFSSEYIGTEVLAYDPVPGAYLGCIPVSETGGKNWSL
ncbi:MAG: gluconate 2-dehydrogenase subunit 3 family protein [Bacteroidota bacterium]